MGIHNHIHTFRIHKYYQKLQRELATFLSPSELKTEKAADNWDWIQRNVFTTAKLSTAGGSTIVYLERADGSLHVKRLLSGSTFRTDYSSESVMTRNPFFRIEPPVVTLPVHDAYTYAQTIPAVLRQIWDADKQETRADFAAAKNSVRTLFSPAPPQNRELLDVLSYYDPAYLYNKNFTTMRIYRPKESSSDSDIKYRIVFSGSDRTNRIVEYLRTGNFRDSIPSTAFDEQDHMFVAEENITALLHEQSALKKKRRRNTYLAAGSLLAAAFLARSCCAGSCGSDNTPARQISHPLQGNTSLEQRLDAGTQPQPPPQDTYHLRVWTTKDLRPDTNTWKEQTPVPSEFFPGDRQRITLQRGEKVYITIDHILSREKNISGDHFDPSDIVYIKESQEQQNTAIIAQPGKDYDIIAIPGGDSLGRSYISFMPKQTMTVVIPLKTRDGHDETEFLNIDVQIPIADDPDREQIIRDAKDYLAQHDLSDKAERTYSVQQRPEKKKEKIIRKNRTFRTREH